MSETLKEQITRSRRLLQNPYAYLDSEGGFDAIPAERGISGKISESRLRLKNPYAYLAGDGRFDAIDIQGAGSSPSFEVDEDDIRDPDLIGKRLSYENIEGITKKLQKTLWRNRRAIWRGNAPDDPIEVLDPAIAFRVIGYNFETEHPLGQMTTHDGLVEVGGIIEKSKRYAGVSTQVPFDMRQFTAAHELGHALLHRAEGLHRDRGLDGSALAGPTERIEVEANKFAVYFLMPEKLLISEFNARYGSNPFVIDDDTSFGLISDTSDRLRRRCKNLRGLSRALASANRYAGTRFESLAERFRISTEAMAIRLEELGLVKF